MKAVCVAIVIICVYSVMANNKYSSKFKNIDLDEIFKNDRLVNAYFKCLNEGHGCTPEGNELSKILPDAIKTGCEKCTDEQKGGAKRVASFLIKEKPDMWNTLVSKYDPDNTYSMTFREQLKAEGFDI